MDSFFVPYQTAYCECLTESAAYFYVHKEKTMMLFLFDGLPDEIAQHLRSFSMQRPEWTQERIMRSALALFLLQNGVNNREVTQVYLEAMFPGYQNEGGVK